MKRVTAFILLLCHINTSMFLPQASEEDMFDKNGNQVDDINTVTEYIYEVVLGNVDKTPDDDDDDSGQNFHMAKIVEYQCPQFVVTEMEKPLAQSAKINKTFDYNTGEAGPVYLDILTPPPEA